MPPQDTMPPAPAFLPSPVKFDDGTIVYPLKALTDYRICHEGRPHEARIVYTCTTTPPSPSASASASASSASSPSQSDSESEPIATHILKIKVQIPGPNHNDGEPTSPSKGPSDTTSLELKALQTFHDVDAKFAPQLLGHASIVQGEADPLPGGYVNYVLMNQMRGETLFDSGFWGRGEEERAEISEKFLESLRSVICSLPNFHPRSEKMNERYADAEQGNI